MVRAIQRISEADKEWRAWKEELARRHIFNEKQKEYDEWKQANRSFKTAYVVDDNACTKNTQSTTRWR